MFYQIADFHVDFCYLFQIVERTWTPPSTEGDKNKSRKRLHLRCRIGTSLFCFLCIETSTAAASSSPRTRACCPYGVAELLTSKVLFKGIRRRCHATFIPTFAHQARGPQQPPLRSAATAQQLRTVGRVVCRRLCRQHAKVKLDKASQFVPADVIHYIYLIQRCSWACQLTALDSIQRCSQAHHSRPSSRPTMSKAPVMLCRRRGRVIGECPRWAIMLRNLYTTEADSCQHESASTVY